MGIKAIFYTLTVPLVLYGMDSININLIFKKDKLLQARIFYLIICLALSYLVTNFLYDFFLNTRVL